MKRTTSFSHSKMCFLIEKIPMFRSLDNAEREKIVQCAHFYIADKDEQIIEQGTLDTSFYVLMSGEARAQLTGLSQPLAELEPGQFFGEISFLLNRPRSCTVVAKQLSILLRIDRVLLGKLTAQVREKIKDQIILKLANMILESNKHQK